MNPDLKAYAERIGITEDEAIQREKIRLKAAPLEAELSQNEVETFAGLWWENEPAFKLVIAFTRDGAKTLQPYLSNKDLRDSPFLEIRQVAYSHNDLQKYADFLVAKAKQQNVRFDAYIDIRANQIKIIALPEYRDAIEMIVRDEALSSVVDV